MSEYFRVVNKTKKEYFEPDSFGESDKYSFLGTEMQGRLLALLLVSREDDSDNHIGSWAGDEIIICGESSGVLIEGEPLYFKVIDWGYKDIAIKALSILCSDGFGTKLVDIAETDVKLKKNLYSVVEQYSSNKKVHLCGLKARLKTKFENT